MLEHASRLNEEIVHVPLMFWGRGIPAVRRVGGLKLARYPRDEGGIDYELYDVRADPHERKNLFDPDSNASRRLIELVESYDQRGERIRAKLLGGAPAEPPERVFLDPRQEQKLRALGYLESRPASARRRPLR